MNTACNYAPDQGRQGIVSGVGVGGKGGLTCKLMLPLVFIY